MFDVILFHPEILSNTGNIIRLCANTGASLHLVKPLGFTLEDRLLRRAGLDYREYAEIAVHETWAACADRFKGRCLFAVSTKGPNGTTGLTMPKAMRFCSVRRAVDCRLRFWEVSLSSTYSTAHDPREPEPQLVEYGSGSDLRGVATARILEGCVMNIMLCSSTHPRCPPAVPRMFALVLLRYRLN